MTAAELRSISRLLRLCDARATALLHPCREHPPSRDEVAASIAVLGRDLAELRNALNLWSDDVRPIHPSD